MQRDGKISTLTGDVESNVLPIADCACRAAPCPDLQHFPSYHVRLYRINGWLRKSFV